MDSCFTCSFKELHLGEWRCSLTHLEIENPKLEGRFCTGHDEIEQRDTLQVMWEKG